MTMTTDEILAKAPALPWTLEVHWAGLARLRAESGVVVELSCAPTIESVAAAALLERAVNAFEAMREVLKRANAVAVFEYGPHDCDCDKPNEGGCDICAIRAALKLADGET